MLHADIINRLQSRLRRGTAKKKRRSGARRHIPRSLGVEGFFDALNANAVRYVCLRWHDNLPAVATGEDIDLLIADEDIPFVEGLFGPASADGTPVDLYTVSGLKGTDYRGVSYFPPRLAQFALQHSRLYKNRYRIPNPEAHFWTMAFHAVYHKGSRSGLAERLGEPSAAPSDHDYARYLAQYAADAGMAIADISLTGLDKELCKAGWCPPTDTLRKYATKNEWLSRRIAELNNRSPRRIERACHFSRS